MPRHILLVGLPGAGKSTVGQLVADGARGRRCSTSTVILARQMGMPVAQIFGMVGEPRFRRRWSATRSPPPRPREPSVIVPGGGWAAQPGQIQEAKQACLIIYLKCTVTTAARRSEQGEVRPLSCGRRPGGAGPDPPGRPGTVLQAR